MNLNHIYCGDALSVLSTFPDNSIQCCITSPPYYGLRNYGTEQTVNTAPDCLHEWKRCEAVSVCLKCGGEKTDAQIGHEQTPEQYIEKLVGVFREVRRVLRKDGTLWLNIGDGYVGGNYRGGSAKNASIKQCSNAGTLDFMATKPLIPRGYKPKDLYGIPWMLAFALRTDGYYLRSDIIWHKPNVFPESVTDRPTKAHEYLFLLTKGSKYYYDADAVKEPAVSDHPSGNGYKRKARLTYQDSDGSPRGSDEQWQPTPTRNRRTVWSINAKGYPEAHFATFPESLVEPCVLAGTREGDTILDPFVGSGTVAFVAKKFDRKYVGIDLHPDYVAMAKKRVGETDDVPPTKPHIPWIYADSRAS